MSAYICIHIYVHMEATLIIWTCLDHIQTSGIEGKVYLNTVIIVSKFML